MCLQLFLDVPLWGQQVWMTCCRLKPPLMHDVMAVDLILHSVCVCVCVCLCLCIHKQSRQARFTAWEIDFNKSVGQEVTSPGVAMETPNDKSSKPAQQCACELAVPLM